MSSPNLRDIQLLELKILGRFIDICDKNDLKWYLIAGSCLGAVRHTGFIPWDDDIDIGMPRKDYTRFLNLAQKYLGEDLFLQTYETDCEYIYNFAKIRDKNTTFIQTPLKDLRMNHGVYIDIFPLDGASNSRIRRKIDRLYLTCLNLGIYCHFLKENNMKWRSKLIGFIIKLIYAPNKLFRKRDNIVKKYDFETSYLVASFFGAWGEKEIVPREYFGKGCYCQFETINAIIPEEYNKYLTNLYGDYMIPPPKEKQVSHHETDIIDLTISYTHYTEKNIR